MKLCAITGPRFAKCFMLSATSFFFYSLLNIFVDDLEWQPLIFCCWALGRLSLFVGFFAYIPEACRPTHTHAHTRLLPLWFALYFILFIVCWSSARGYARELCRSLRSMCVCGTSSLFL